MTLVVISAVFEGSLSLCLMSTLYVVLFLILERPRDIMYQI